MMSSEDDSQGPWYRFTKSLTQWFYLRTHFKYINPSFNI